MLAVVLFIPARVTHPCRVFRVAKPFSSDAQRRKGEEKEEEEATEEARKRGGGIYG